MAQQYDVASKLLLGRRDGALFPALFGGPVRHWYNVELPRIENKRPDLIAESDSGVITYLEIVARNRDKYALQLMRKLLAVEERFPGREVRPVLFYIGPEPLRMKSPHRSKYWTLRFHAFDIRDFDSETLLGSEHLGDNMLAILAEADRERVIERVLERLSRLEAREREDQGALFAVLSGLRDLESEIMERVHEMLTMQDMLDNTVIGPLLKEHANKVKAAAVKKAVKKAVAKGLAQGKAEGRAEGERTVLLQLIEQRFGPLPEAAQRRFAAATEPELAAVTQKLLKARSLAQLLACLDPSH